MKVFQQIYIVKWHSPLRGGGSPCKIVSDKRKLMVAAATSFAKDSFGYLTIFLHNLAGQPEENHTHNHCAAQGFGPQRKNKGRNRNQKLRLKKVYYPGLTGCNKLGQKKCAQDRSRYQIEPFDKPPRKAAPSQCKKREPARKIGNQAHATNKKKIFTFKHVL